MASTAHLLFVIISTETKTFKEFISKSGSYFYANVVILKYLFIVCLLDNVSVGVALFFVCLGFVALAACAKCPLLPYFVPNKPLLRADYQV